MSVATEVKVKVRNIAVGGAGVGEVVEQYDGSGDLLGITAFVPFTAVGEEVKARVEERKERYVHAQLLEVLTASLERTKPACKYFQTCGGCELQHIEYDEQLRAKRAMIVGALRAGQISAKIVDLVAPLKPSLPLGYRRRIKLHVDSTGKVGFYRTQSRSIVEIDKCPVADPLIGATFERLGDLGKALKGQVSSINLESDDAGVVAVLTAAYAMSEAAARDIKKIAREFFPNIVLIAGGKEMGGVGRQILELPLDTNGSLKLRVPAGSFSQVNWGVNQALVKRVCEAAESYSDSTVYDLFAGAGNFALPLAATGASVTAVEVDPRLVSLGRESAEAARLSKKLKFLEMSVEKFFKTQKIPNDAIIVADPPRNGLGPLVEELKTGSRLLFVSCHLPSFVRDLKKLLAAGWQAERIEPFDMFAQTSYVELLGVLTRP